jgi:hypothetical protein
MPNEPPPDPQVERLTALVNELTAEVARLQVELARVTGTHDTMAPLFTLALRAVESGDIFDYMAARDKLRAAAKAYRMAEAAREWEGPSNG